jgi:hypothetical protein
MDTDLEGDRMMEKVKTGIIGLGKVAHMHAKALKNIPESDFTAVCSRDIKKAKAFAEQYNVKAYNDVEEMVISGGVEALVICTPHPNHAEVAVKAIGAGAHVLVEKPLASSLGDCDAIIEASKAKGVKVGVVSQRRFYPPVQRIKRAIDEGKIGMPVLGIVNMLGWRDQAYYNSDPWRGTWEGEGGGVLVNFIDCFVGKNISSSFSILKMGGDVSLGLRTVKLWNLTFDVDALPDGRVALFSKLVPQLILTNQYQCHRILGVHAVVEQKPQFLKSFACHQVGFIDDRYDTLIVHHTK